VKLRTSDTGALAQTPISIVTALRQTVARIPDHPALGIMCKAESLSLWCSERTLSVDMLSVLRSV
jgi:hypothetical protein